MENLVYDDPVEKESNAEIVVQRKTIQKNLISE